MSNLKFNFIVKESAKRLDLLLVEYFEEIDSVFSRTSIQNVIKQGLVLVNNKVAKSSLSLKENDHIDISIPAIQKVDLTPEEIPLRIIYEDNDIIVINKQAGLVVHPGAGNPKGTLLNGVLFHTNGKISDIGYPDRPGIVHRLDKDTTGLIVVAKSNEAHLDLARQFAEKTAKRVYVAIVNGDATPLFYKTEGNIRTFYSRHPSNRVQYTSKCHSGKVAITNFQIMDSTDKYSLLRINLETGRTHQIRVHFFDNNLPLLGEKMYTKSGLESPPAIGRQALHAKMLSFKHPRYNLIMTFCVPIEDDILKNIKEIFNNH